MQSHLRRLNILIISLYMTSDFLGESVEMAYKCQNCDYVSQDLSNHRRHLEGVHGGAMYKCMICSKDFKWQRSLRRHMVLNHSFGASGIGFDGFDNGNAKSFTHNGAVKMLLIKIYGLSSLKLANVTNSAATAASKGSGQKATRELH